MRVQPSFGRGLPRQTAQYLRCQTGKQIQKAVTSLTAVCLGISLDFVVTAIFTLLFLWSWTKLNQETVSQDRDDAKPILGLNSILTMCSYCALPLAGSIDRRAQALINRVAWFNFYTLLPYITFIFMHFADTFIQSDFQCIQVIHVLSVCVFPGNRTQDLLHK